jgi:hypothetical protein
MENIIRKSLKDISWQVSEEEYRADPAYSYSTIAKFDREGFEKLDTLFDKVESPSLLFGSCVDTLLTDGQEAFDSRFFVADFPEIADNVKKIVDNIFREFSDKYITLDKVPDKDIIFITEMLDYQKNWKPETRAKVIREKGSEYYNLLYLAGDKTVITSNFYADVLACIEELKTSEATKWYFQDDDPFDDSIERLYQLKFKGEYEGISLRIMMDLALVDHQNKIIYPCDLKTSYKEEYNFFKSFIDWKYYIQAQLYWEILRQNLDKDPYFKDFKLADYRFIVVCNRTRNPLVWEYYDTRRETDMVYGKDRQLKLKNWRKIVKDLHYYLTQTPKVPIGINVEGTNDIIHWLNNY